MLRVRLMTAPLFLILFASLCTAQSLSQYRGLQIGASVEEIISQVGKDSSDVRVLHTAPAVIQELEWDPQRGLVARPKFDSIKQIRFSFFNGGLYKMVVAYNYLDTEGLTENDLVEVISSEFGVARVPDAGAVVAVSGGFFENNQKLLAVWEGPEHSYSLFRSNGGSFGLVIVSQAIDASARAATVESLERARSEAPQREAERRAQEQKDREALQQKARTANKPKFRP